MLDALMKSYREEYANVHRGLHYLANAATDAYEGARTRVAKFLNAPNSKQIVFTKNATEAINLAAQSFGGMVISPGDEIVLSMMEHHSNIIPWHFHRERRGAVIKWVPVTDRGRVPPGRFRGRHHPAHQNGRDYAYVERPGHRDAS